MLTADLGGTDEGTWTYPSPQMFWNALVRKDKLDYTSETDIDAVVAIHNNMNENSWKQVMSWEKLHTIQGEGKEPKLLRFVGRPNDFSPKARLKMLFGHIQPFDRHDWVVDRGGVEVRYVLDYYHDESGTAKDRVPQLTDAESIQSIKVDVRPALDSITAITDRMWRMPLERYVMGNRVGYLPPPFFADKSVKEAEVLKKQRFREIVKSIENSCSEKRKKLDECDSEADCRMAGIAFQLCSAQLICPSVAADFNKCLHSCVDEEQKEIPKHLTSLQKCFEDFQLEYGERG